MRKYQQNRTYEGRVLVLVNSKLQKQGFNTKKYKMWRTYQRWIKEREPPEYPFHAYKNLKQRGSATNGDYLVQIRTSKKYKSSNLKGIVEVKKFIQPLLGKQPQIDELSDFIVVYTEKEINSVVSIKKDSKVSNQDSNQVSNQDFNQDFNQDSDHVSNQDSDHVSNQDSITLISAEDGCWEDLA